MEEVNPFGANRGILRSNLNGWRGSTLDIEVGLGEAEEDLDDVARA